MTDMNVSLDELEEHGRALTQALESALDRISDPEVRAEVKRAVGGALAYACTLGSILPRDAPPIVASASVALSAILLERERETPPATWPSPGPSGEQ